MKSHLHSTIVSASAIAFALYVAYLGLRSKKIDGPLSTFVAFAATATWVTVFYVFARYVYRTSPF